MTLVCIVCERVGGYELYSLWKAFFFTYSDMSLLRNSEVTHSACAMRLNRMQITQSCSVCVGTKQGDPHVRVDSACWLTLCSETWVNSLSCLPHEIGPLKIPQFLFAWVCACTSCTYLTGSNTSLLICVIHGCVCLHKINLVFCVLIMLGVLSLQRERNNSQVQKHGKLVPLWKYCFSCGGNPLHRSSFPSPPWQWPRQSMASRTIDPSHFYCNLPCTSAVERKQIAINIRRCILHWSACCLLLDKTLWEWLDSL